MFDAVKESEALNPPKVRVMVDGEPKEYTGRILSFPQVKRFRGRFAEIADSENPQDDVVDLLTELYEAAGFPPEVAENIPYPLMEAAMVDFFESLETAADKYEAQTQTAES